MCSKGKLQHETNGKWMLGCSVPFKMHFSLRQKGLLVSVCLLCARLENRGAGRNVFQLLLKRTPICSNALTYRESHCGVVV